MVTGRKRRDVDTRRKGYYAISSRLAQIDQERLVVLLGDTNPVQVGVKRIR